MIGSHDTFTYLKPTCGLYNHFSRLWRTQCKTIKEQYERGVRFFDIRVCKYRKQWAFAHGLVTFPILFPTITDICRYIEKEYPLAVYRIVLERGGILVEDLFNCQVREYNRLNKDNNLWLADVKFHRHWRGELINNSERLYWKGYAFTRNSCTWTEPNKELHGSVGVHNFWKINLKKEARKINSQIGMGDLTKLQEMYEDPTRLYLLDYCTNEYD